MDNQIQNSIVSFIWGIADDCLRDVYVRGKYRDVIPAIKEQEEILKKLDSTLSKIDELIEIKKSEISGLHELKNRLISDVVTGNIDVRDIEIPEYEFTDESADSDLGDVDEEQED